MDSGAEFPFSQTSQQPNTSTSNCYACSHMEIYDGQKPVLLAILELHPHPPFLHLGVPVSTYEEQGLGCSMERNDRLLWKKKCLCEEKMLLCTNAHPIFVKWLTNNENSTPHRDTTSSTLLSDCTEKIQNAHQFHSDTAISLYLTWKLKRTPDCTKKKKSYKDWWKFPMANLDLNPKIIIS